MLFISTLCSFSLAYQLVFLKAEQVLQKEHGIETSSLSLRLCQTDRLSNRPPDGQTDRAPGKFHSLKLLLSFSQKKKYILLDAIIR